MAAVIWFCTCLMLLLAVCSESNSSEGEIRATSSTPANLSEVLDTLTSAILTTSSVQCRDGWSELFNTPDTLAGNNGIRALDAFGKVGAGYYDGNEFALGSYDQCNLLPAVQYCLVDFNIENLNSNSDSFEYVNLNSDLELLYALCLPQSCMDEDIREAVNLTSSALHRSLTIKRLDCERDNKAPYNAGSIIIILVWCLFGMTVIVATATQLITKKMEEYGKKQQKTKSKVDAEIADRTVQVRRKNKNTLFKFFMSFSLYETVPKIFATGKQPEAAITCLHGIRVISMTWVILVHVSLFTFLFSENNTSYILNTISKFSFRAVSGAPFAVDSFFLMSGLLVTYLTLRKMERRKGKFKFPAFLYYVHRFLRITPVYAFVLFSYWLLTVHLADGPMWQQLIGQNSAFYQSCKRYWWTNLLYINNLHPKRHLEICMPWTWYMANDMQFYIVAPLIIIPLAISYPVGLTISVLSLIANLAIIGGIGGGYGLSSNSDKAEELVKAVNDENPDPHTTIDDIYTKPWTRVTPYLIGIIIGFILFKRQKKTVFNRSVYNVLFYGGLWIIAAGMCFSVVYGRYGPFTGENFNRAEDISYLMLSRLTWSVGLAIIIFICHHGYGGIVNRFLSMKFWIPLSRLTFTVYLVHGVVLYVLIFTSRRPYFSSNYNHILYYITTYVLSVSVAVVIASLVEFPLANVEELAFKMAGFKERESTRVSTARADDCEIKRNVGFEDDENGEEGSGENWKREKKKKEEVEMEVEEEEEEVEEVEVEMEQEEAREAETMFNPYAEEIEQERGVKEVAEEEGDYEVQVVNITISVEDDEKEDVKEGSKGTVTKENDEETPNGSNDGDSLSRGSE